MNAEQWLADIEEKAQAASQGKWETATIILPSGDVVTGIKCDGDEVCNMGQSLLHEELNADHIAAANPAAVLRLVDMVRSLAVIAGDRTCVAPLAGCTKGTTCDKCAIQYIYQQTEPKACP